METAELKKIKTTICDAFLIEEAELRTVGKNKTSVQMAQYAFSYIVYEKTLNIHNAMWHVGIKNENQFRRYMRKHLDNLCNPTYRRIVERIENKIIQL